MARQTKAQQAERAKAITELRAMLKPGDTIYAICRHRAASGMFRRISLLLLPGTAGERPYHLDYIAAKAMGDKCDGNGEGIKISGCGQDMGFALVYNLGRTLWPEGFPCAGEACRSNDHSNGMRDRTPGHCTHTDGGYALHQDWL